MSLRQTRLFLTLPLLASAALAADETASKQAVFDSFPPASTLRAAAGHKTNAAEWVHNAVFYQIYPQSYRDTNGDGIGDLRGIMEKLDYIKSLGVDAIWLNPFYDSPFNDAGYDVRDYYKVAPRYGTNEDAKELFQQAAEKGLRVIVDLVIGYTSIDHPWFIASCSPEPNKYSNWYIWTDDTWFPGQENYTAGFVQGYCERNGNFLQNFFWNEPALNYGYGELDPEQKWQLPVDHPDILALHEEVKHIMRFWLDLGADGFRCDMGGSLVKHDRPGRTSQVWGDFLGMMKREYPDAFSVAEWDNAERASAAGFTANFIHWNKEYYDLWFRDEDSYFLSAGRGDITRWLGMYLRERQGSLGRDYITLTVGNHDLPRIRRWGRDRTDLELIQVFAFTMPNVPFVYYGDEIGMRQLPIRGGKEGSYGTRAGDRTPMQWNDGVNLGFSTGSPASLYFPVDDAPDAPTVAAEENDPDSMLNFMRRLIALKKSHPALLAYADFFPVYAQPHAYPYVFLRANAGETILVAINPANRESTATIKGTPGGKPALLMGTKLDWQQTIDATTVTVPARSFAIYTVE